MRNKQKEAKGVPGVPFPEMPPDGYAQRGRTLGQSPWRTTEISTKSIGESLPVYDTPVDHNRCANVARRHQNVGNAID